MSYHQQGNNERNVNKDIEGQWPRKVVEFVSKPTFKPLVRSFLGWYEGILVFCRAIAVSLDPLFFYVPVINEDTKCIGLNKDLWTIAIVSRSVTDFIYLVHYVVKSVVKSKIRKEPNDESNSKERNDESNTVRVKGRRYFWPFFMLNILVILPIPQVVMSRIFSEMRRTKSSNITILNSVVLLQYGPRVFQIYRSWKKLISAEKFNEASLWIKASFNLFLYILAGHVLGAFWYFFSTQRLTACWHKACENRTDEISFKCGHSSRNLSFLDGFCPIDTPNPSTFNFGIFLEARRSGILESTGFLQKVFYSFSWGMRNLSSFGSNLQTSSYIWENFFALGISIFGLLLFLYFMGNLQMYMQWRATKSIEKYDEEKKVVESRKRRKRQEESIELWLSKEEVPTPMRKLIIEFIHKRFVEDEDVNVENLIPDLPLALQQNVKRHICLNLLKNLNIIKKNGLTKHQQLLINICDSLKLVSYNEQSYIVKEGDPIDAVFLITYGIAWTYPSSNNGEGKHAERLEKGHFFGEELLELLWNPSSVDMYNLSKLPISSKTLKTHTKVEAFALMAKDLKDIDYSRFSQLDPEQSQVEAASTQEISLQDQNPAELDVVVESKEASILQRVRCCNQPKCWCFKKTSESSST